MTKVSVQQLPSWSPSVQAKSPHWSSPSVGVKVQPVPGVTSAPQMPAYRPLAEDWVTNNPLLRSRSTADLGAVENEAGTIQRLCDNCASELSDQITPNNFGVVQRFHVNAKGRKEFDCPAYAGDSKLEACLNNEDRLRPSDTGDPVTKVQTGLQNDGGDLGKDGTSGVYGADTGKAVIAFKTKHNLGFTQYPDVGPGTMKKLDEICPKKKEEPKPDPNPNPKPNDLDPETRINLDKVQINYQFMVMRQRDAIAALARDVQSGEQEEASFSDSLFKGLAMMTFNQLYGFANISLRAGLKALLGKVDENNQEQKNVANAYDNSNDKIFDGIWNEVVDWLKKIAFAGDPDADKDELRDKWFDRYLEGVERGIYKAQLEFVKKRVEVIEPMPPSQVKQKKAKEWADGTAKAANEAYDRQYKQTLNAWAIYQAQANKQSGLGKRKDLEGNQKKEWDERQQKRLEEERKNRRPGEPEPELPKDYGTDLRTIASKNDIPGVLYLTIEGTAPSPLTPFQIKKATIAGLSPRIRKQLQSKWIGQLEIPVVALGEFHFPNDKSKDGDIVIGRNEQQVYNGRTQYGQDERDNGIQFLKYRAAFQNHDSKPDHYSPDDGAEAIFKYDLEVKQIGKLEKP